MAHLPKEFVTDKSQRSTKQGDEKGQLVISPSEVRCWRIWESEVDCCAMETVFFFFSQEKNIHETWYKILTEQVAEMFFVEKKSRDGEVE